MKETFSQKHNRLNSEALERIRPIYGQAMLSWANIEDALCGWFEVLSGMDKASARAVFFSARSFNARADMIEAILATTKSDKDRCDFVREAIAKCVMYNSTRNMLAHRIPVINTTNPESHIVELHEGGGHPFLMGKPVTAADLVLIAENFGRLGKLIRDAWIHATQKVAIEQQVPLPTLGEQVYQMPNLANSSGPSQKQQARARQRKSSRA